MSQSSGFLVTTLLDDLGIPYREYPNRVTLCCVVHADRNPSMSFYYDTMRAFCYGCEASLDFVAFYAKVRGINRDKAEDDLTKKYGILPQRFECNTYRRDSERLKAEKALNDHKGKVPYQQHASWGEQLDQLLWQYEKGQISEDGLTVGLKSWYQGLENYASITEQRRVAGDSVDDRIQEGSGDVPGSRSEDSTIDLD